MRYITMTCLVCLLMASAASAQTTPYQAQVIGDGVRTRSGPGDYWYPTGKLNKGDKVTVVAKQFGWAEIVPPRGHYFLVLQGDIALNGTIPCKGTVKSTESIGVRSGPIEELRSNRVQLYLRPGAEVSVRSAVGKDYYQIDPPEKATVYVKASLLGEVGATSSTNTATNNTTPATGNTTSTTTNTTTTTTTNTTTTSRPDATTVRTTPAAGGVTSQPTPAGVYIARIREDQKLIAEQVKKPLLDRDYSVVYKRLEELKADLVKNPTTIRGLNQYADRYLAYVQKQIDAQDQVRKMATTRPDVDQILREVQTKMAMPPLDAYQATGILEKSTVLGSSSAMPRLHKLQTEDGQKVLCYVLPDDGDDWSGMLGKVVTITGKKEYRAEWNAILVRPQQVAMAGKIGPPPTGTGTGIDIPPPPVPKGIEEELLKGIFVDTPSTGPTSAPDSAKTQPEGARDGIVLPEDHPAAPVPDLRVRPPVDSQPGT